MSSATSRKIHDFWTVILSIDATFTSASDTYTSKTVKESPHLKNFLDHCSCTCHCAFGVRSHVLVLCVCVFVCVL